MVINGQRVSAEITNAAYPSRTVNTSIVGKIDVNNTTDSTASTSGAIHTTGGLGVEKKAYVGTDLNVGANIIAVGNVNATNLVASANVIATSVGADSVNAQTGLFQFELTTNALNAQTATLTGLTVTNNAVINGDLTVNGTTTTINSSVLEVVDKNILVNKGGSDATSEGAGLTVKRTAVNGSIIYKAASASKFAIGNVGSEIDVTDVSSTQTLTNKTIAAASNSIVTAASGNLTSIELNAALSELQTDIDTRSTQTNLTSHTGATTSVHGIADTALLVTLSGSQTLTNKSLSDSTLAIVDSADATKQIKFDVAGTTATSTTITSAQTANRVVTIPDATTTLVGADFTQTLTNKTISGALNTLSNISLTAAVTGVLPIANGGTSNGVLAVTAGGVLYTDGSKVVNVGAGTAGQVLTSSGAAAPTWTTATASSGGGGGGGSFKWYSPRGIGPIIDEESEQEIYLFSEVFSSGGTGQYLTGNMKMTNAFTTFTTAQGFLHFKCYTPATTGRYKFELTTTLIKDGVDAFSSIANQNVTSVEITIGATSNLDTIISLAYTGATGLINGQTVTANDTLKFRLRRIAASTTEDTNDIRLVPASTEIYI